MKYSSIIIGHVSDDENIDHLGNGMHIPGGAVLFSSASAYALGYNVLAVTRLNIKDAKRLDAFTLPKENIKAVYCESSTSMYNRYLTPDKERRISKCLSVGTPFEISDIPDVDAEIIHFGGLVYGDFPDEMIIEASKKAKVAFDVQECLRHVKTDGTGEMYYKDWANKKEMLPYIDFLKTDAAEAEILTGTDDRKKAAEILYSWGSKEILITHNSEVLAYDGDKMLTCPIRSRNLSGRTGRGDTTFAAYINERTDHDLAESLLWATATVSLKMETPGPIKATRQDIQNYIDLMYNDIK